MDMTRRTNSPWGSFGLLTDLNSELDQLFTGFDRSETGNRSALQPRVDIKETENGYRVHADVPGLEKKDINVSVDGKTLRLSGKRESEKKEKDQDGYLYTERRFGSFERSFSFPVEIDAQKIKASYRQGVLEIELPKSEKAKPKTIDVEIK